MPSRPRLAGVGEDGRAVALDVVRGTAGGDGGGAGRCRFGRPGACGMTTGAHFGARRAAARGTHMKRESPMAIGFLTRLFTCVQGLANRRLQPLGHVSGDGTSVSATPSTVKDLDGRPGGVRPAT